MIRSPPVCPPHNARCTLPPVRSVIDSCLDHRFHLLAAIAQIENLGSLDTGSNTAVAALRARFGADFRIDLAPPVKLLLEGVERAGVVAWLECTLAENAGGPLHIGFHLEPGYSVANCLAIHHELRLRDVR